MKIARYYRMTAKPGEAAALVAATRALAATLATIPGYESGELLQAADAPDRIVFIERWASAEAYKTGGALLPREILKALMATLGEPPENETYDVLSA